MIIANEHCALTALCDVRKSEELGIQHYQVPLYKDLPSLLNEGPAFDVLNICTPNGLHYEHAILGLRNNKHLVIEKPLTLKKDHAQKIIQLSEEKEKKVFCVMQNRYSPPIKWLKEILDENKLGNIYIVKIDCYWNRDDPVSYTHLTLPTILLV